MTQYSKHKTMLRYYNNGKVISSSVYTKDEPVTQEQVNVAMPLILRIHNEQPNRAHVKVMQGNKMLQKLFYKPTT